MNVAQRHVPLIWVVDDDEDVAAHLQLVIRRSGIEVDVLVLTTADELHAALRERERAPDLVLLDEILPQSRGSALVADVRAAHPQVPVRLITAAPDEVAAADRSVGVIAKPPSAEEILALLSP